MLFVYCPDSCPSSARRRPIFSGGIISFALSFSHLNPSSIPFKSFSRISQPSFAINSSSSMSCRFPARTRLFRPCSCFLQTSKLLISLRPFHLFFLLGPAFVTLLDGCIRNESFVTRSLHSASFQIHSSAQMPKCPSCSDDGPFKEALPSRLLLVRL